MTDSVCLAVYHHALKQRANARYRTGNVANSDVILPNSNRVGISWIPIFMFTKHNLADRRVSDILICMITMLQLLREKGMVVILETRAQ